jgi:hypothetical protein
MLHIVLLQQGEDIFETHSIQIAEAKACAETPHPTAHIHRQTERQLQRMLVARLAWIHALNAPLIPSRIGR